MKSLYGKDYIVEPSENDSDAKKVASEPETANNKKTSDTIVDTDGKTVINNYTTNNITNNYGSDNGGGNVYVAVSAWPMIHYIYTPSYVVYVSPWYWYYYPTWWSPWSPWYWHDYYWHHHNYYHHWGYHRTTYYRAPIAHGYYGLRRSASISVQNYRAANVYKTTYTKRSHVDINTNSPGTANPGFRNRPSNNNVSIKEGKNTSVKDYNASGKNGNRPSSNVNSKPSQQTNKPISKPNNKPSVRPNNNFSPSKPNQNNRSKPNPPKSGGGKKR